MLGKGVKEEYDEAVEGPKEEKTLGEKIVDKVGQYLVEAPRTSITSMDQDFHEDQIEELHPMRNAPI
jgi:hypothetical protein